VASDVILYAHDKLPTSQYKNGRRHSLAYIPTVIDRLIGKGFVVIKTKNNKKYFELTEGGQRELKRYQLKEFVIPKQRRWDKKWRAIIFDIKEYRRRDRNQIRIILKRAGFVKLQASVWVYPYDCEDMLFLIKTSLSLGKDMLYMVVDRIENDRWLKKEFNLN